MVDTPHTDALFCRAPDATASYHGGDVPCGSYPRSRAKFKLGHGGARVGAGRPRKIVASSPQESWAGPRWIVYQTFPQAERLAARELTREGYRTYLPLIADRRRNPVIKSMWHKVLVCRFAGYGFVELGPTDPWLPVRKTSGVSAVLLSAGKPAPIPVGEIERHMADDEVLCDLARDILPAHPAGAYVKIEAGAFADRTAVVISCNGMVTTAEVEMLGRTLPVPFARSMVVAL